MTAQQAPQIPERSETVKRAIERLHATIDRARAVSEKAAVAPKPVQPRAK
jgi:hypothetical protein